MMPSSERQRPPERSRSSRGRLHVVIAGGGVAALEALLALRALVGHRVTITLLAPEREFLPPAMTVTEAFGRGEARSYSLPEILADQHRGRFVWGSLAGVEPADRVAVTDSGERIAFDALIVAVGAIATDPLPGALTFRGRADVPALRALLDELEAGTARSVALVLPAARMWPVPIYELALMTAAELRAREVQGTEVSLLTPEHEPLELFGADGSRAIEPLLRAHGIRLRTDVRPATVDGRGLVLAGGDEIHVDRMITVPQLTGPRVPGLPHDALGFIPVDSHGRVDGLRDVYAAGDSTAGPLKQGGLAAQQADAVAETIAGELGIPISPRSHSPVLRGLLMTGGAPLYLRAAGNRSPANAGPTGITPLRRGIRDAAAAVGQPLWWPPAKIAGRYLGPFLDHARPGPAGPEPLIDRSAVPGRPLSEADYADALELTLLLADGDARCGDYTSALNALDAAAVLHGALPPEYEAKRRQWQRARRVA